MDASDFRRSENVEDRRRRDPTQLPGTFGGSFIDAPPNVFEGNGGLLTGLKLDDLDIVQMTPAGAALGLGDLERSALGREQDRDVRDALDNASVAAPGDHDLNGPPVRINNRTNANPAPFMLQPVDHQPDFGYSLVPVDHNPFT